MRGVRPRMWTLLSATLVAAACSANGGPGAVPAEAPDEQAVVQPRPARALALPGQPRSGGGVATELRWDLPGDWIEETPSSPMRRAQYRVPGPGGDGECVVFYFGPGQGGDPAANAVRWARQFEQADGSSSLDAMQVRELAGNGIVVQLVEIRGTFDGGMTMTDAPAERKPDYMLLGGIAQGPDAPWFFKFTGPEETVRARRADFESLLESLRE